jgi:hypothetical protein
MPTETMSIGRLYRHFKSKHILGDSYKTFQREVYELIQQGKLIGIRQRGGAQGNTCLVSLPELQTPVRTEQLQQPSQDSPPPEKRRGRHKKGCTCPTHKK